MRITRKNCDRAKLARVDEVYGVGKVEQIERQIKDLSEEEMAELREWFAAFDAEAWDRKFEADVRAGKLDALEEKALKAHASGDTTKL
jgi:hypothetical protein